MAFDWFGWLIIPFLIFCARILDVSIGTMRMIFISRGFKTLAPMLAFFEVLIWLVALREIMSNLDNVMTFFAYALGFESGTFVGMHIEEKISMGKVIMRIITKRDASVLLDEIKQANYNVIGIEAEGNVSKVKLIFTIIDRQDVPQVIQMVCKFNPQAFYTIEDIRYTSRELPSHTCRRGLRDLFGFFHKGK